MAAPADTSAPIRYHNIYICPFSQRLMHALVAVLLVICGYLQDHPQYTHPGVAPFLLGVAIGLPLVSIILDPDTAIRSTRVEPSDAGEKGDGDKGGKMVIVSRPLVGYEVYKIQVEATGAMDERLGGMRFEADIRV